MLVLIEKEKKDFIKLNKGKNLCHFTTSKYFGVTKNNFAQVKTEKAYLYRKYSRQEKKN